MVIEKFLFDKCVILLHSSGNSTPDITVHVGLYSLKPFATSKCLGTWLTSDLMPHKAIAENIAKARRAFFAYGSMVTLILCQPEELLKPECCLFFYLGVRPGI